MRYAMSKHHYCYITGIISILVVVLAFLAGRSAGRLEAEHFWHLKCQSLGDIHARTLRDINAQMDNQLVGKDVMPGLSLTDALNELIHRNADIRVIVFSMEYFRDNQRIDREAFAAEVQAITKDIMLDYRNQTRFYRIGRYRGDY